MCLLSVVRRASSAISLNIFSSQTAGPIWTKLGRNVPWEVLFKNYSQNLIPSKTLVALATKSNFLSNSLKNLLLWNRWSDFEIISQECSLGDPFQKLFAKFWSAQKHGSGEWGLLALYGHEEILKKSCSLKLRVRFWNNFTGMFLWWPFSKNCWRNFDPSINMALVNGGFLHYKDMKKFLKNLLLRNCWSDFEIISREYSLSDPFQKLFAKFWSVYKYCSGEWGLFALYRHGEILKKSCSQKLLVRFWNNFTEIRFWH